MPGAGRKRENGWDEKGNWLMQFLRKFDYRIPVQIPTRVPWNENYNPRTRLPDLHSPLTAVARRFSLKIPSAFTKHRLSIV